MIAEIIMIVELAKEPPKPKPAEVKPKVVVVEAPESVESIIHSVFGEYGSQAVSVAMCESTLNTSAANGQYLGLFQMGEYERATYGHGTDALTQARAAYAYFAATDFDWSPWVCKP